jgi:electron transfer flavoprotein alpha/beta subunit
MIPPMIDRENNEALSRLEIALRHNDSRGVEQAIDLLTQTDSGASIFVTLAKACAQHAIRSLRIGER